MNMHEDFPHFTLRSSAEWEGQLLINTHPYGRQVLLFAATWANMMENAMAKGETLRNRAKDLGYAAAGSVPVSFAQYMAAAAVLCKVWAHGEELDKLSTEALSMRLALR